VGVFSVFRGKASTYLACHFMTVKTVSMVNQKSIIYLVFFEIRLRRNRRLQRFKFRLYPRRGTKAFLSATVKDVFQRAAVFGRATVAEQPYIPVVGGSVN
jgi:hypothetical protein